MRRLRHVFIAASTLSLLQCAPGVSFRPDSVQEFQGNPDDASASGIEFGPGEIESADPEVSVDVSSPVVILDALTMAYPGRITDLAIRDGDWSVLVNDTVVYWAEGRMLDAALREDAESYHAYSFKPYPKDVPPVRQLSAEEEARLRSRIDEREGRRDARSDAFLVALWGMDGFWEAEGTVVIREFLGRRIRIHPDLEPAFAAIEDDIRSAAQKDDAIAAWLDSLGAVGAYVWRDIAGSANRSLHSFGIAVDVQPEDYHGTQAYWRWAADFEDEWWTIPHSRRYPMPNTVIEAFEAQGFIWGGKWFLFDQIHFEYRPELIILGEWAAGTKRIP